MVPAVVCSACGRQVLLPYRRFAKSLVVEPYWPPHLGRLNWVCDACGRHESSAEGELQWLSGESLSPVPADHGFWRVEIPCSIVECSQTVVVHTQTFGLTSRRSLGLMVAKASPTPRCASDHPLSAERCYPERVDFVEWVGTEEYLV